MIKSLSIKVQGILFAIIALSVFAFADAGLKVTSAGHSPFEVALYMNIFTIIFVIPLIFYCGGIKKIVAVKSIKLHLLRSSFMLVNFLLVIYAFNHLPIATIYTILFTMPFTLNILAMFVFKEHISPYRWLAIIIGFSGVLIAMRPGIEPISLAVIIMFVATIFNASGTITTKAIDKNDHWLSFIFYLMLFQTPILSTIVLYQGGSLLPDLTNMTYIPWFVAGGFAFTIGLSLIPQALQRIDASIFGSLVYLVFPWGVFYGYFIFDDVPDGWTLGGAAIIIASGLYLIYREKREHSKLLETD